MRSVALTTLKSVSWSNMDVTKSSGLFLGKEKVNVLLAVSEKVQIYKFTPPETEPVVIGN